MKKFRAAVVGYGNIGKFTVEALEAAPDFEIAGIVRRQGAKDKPAELANYEVVDDITKLKDVDVAILATPTRSCPEYAEKNEKTMQTDIYALTEFSPRKGENISKGYLQGRYGAIPFIGGDAAWAE